MDDVNEMDKCIKCLYLEVPESIANDIKGKWQNVKKIINREDSLIEFVEEALNAEVYWDEKLNVYKIISVIK